MRRWLLRIGVALLALVVTLAAVWGASRLLGPTSEQRRAVDVFEQLPPPQGSNAFPALWLLQWDVPEAEQAAIVAEDAERFRALPPPGDPARGAAGFRSVAAERYEDLEAALAAEPASCEMREDGCLDRVRAERDAHAARLEQSAHLVDRVQAVFDHDHYRNLLPPALDTPFPRLQLMTLAQTRHALQFVDGDVDAALAGTCRRVDGWRRLAGNADSLIVTMYAAAGIQGDGRLLADMLAELPPDHALPSNCTAALAPLQAGDLTLCPAMRGEWELGTSALDALETEMGLAHRARQWLLWDREATVALSARNLAWPCGEEAEQAMAEDRPMRAPLQDGGWRFECVANVMGCVLMDIATPAYADYGLRLQDAGAQIRVLRTLGWLRGRSAAGDARSARALLADVPDGLRGPGRAVEVDPDGRHLRIELFDTRRADHWRVPLPPDLQVQPAAP